MNINIDNFKDTGLLEKTGIFTININFDFLARGINFDSFYNKIIKNDILESLCEVYNNSDTISLDFWMNPFLIYFFSEFTDLLCLSSRLENFNESDVIGKFNIIDPYIRSIISTNFSIDVKKIDTSFSRSNMHIIFITESGNNDLKGVINCLNIPISPIVIKNYNLP